MTGDDPHRSDDELAPGIPSRLARLARLRHWARTHLVLPAVLYFALMVSIWYVATHSEAWVAYPLTEVEMAEDPEVTFSPDGAHFLTMGRFAGPVRIWDSPSGSLLQDLHDKARVARYSRNGRWIGVVGQSGDIVLYDAFNRRRASVLAEVSGSVMDIDFSHDGKFLAAGREDGSVTIWDVHKRKRVRALKGLSSEVQWVRFSAEGERLAAMCLLDGVIVWNLCDGDVVSKFNEYTEMDAPVHSADFSLDGRWVATAHNNGASRLLNVDQGIVAGRWDDCDPGMHLAGTAVFSPDSRLLALGQGTKIVRVADGKVLVRGSSWFGTWRMRFSDDGTRLLADDSVLDALTGQILFTFRRDGDEYLSVKAFAPEGDAALVVTDAEEFPSVWHRRRPEWWWGIFWLPALWVAVAVAGVFTMVLLRDVRYVRRVKREGGQV